MSLLYVTGLPAETLVDRYVTVGTYSLLRSSTIEPECIGQHSILMEGSLVETNSILGAGSVLPPRRQIPTGDLWAGNPARCHGRKVWEPGASARCIASMLEELASLKVMTKPMQQRYAMQWQKPNEGWIKINTDAAFDTGTCTGNAGVVIRNHDSLVQAAAARWFDDIPDVLTAEVMAAKEGLELAVECGLFR
ncbi:hypothetical protein HU200_041864 [Digitaria exilis]|uniref:RNase H type-1 domain-containing protein n=1 Tax=Digitaria exilis TaxID=1010633 RepID=A0A835EFC2_9POAL|nr:hypothetical protein HU200_041864 [Digitaria exilis]